MNNGMVATSTQISRLRGATFVATKYASGNVRATVIADATAMNPMVVANDCQ